MFLGNLASSLCLSLTNTYITYKYTLYVTRQTQNNCTSGEYSHCLLVFSNKSSNNSCTANAETNSTHYYVGGCRDPKGVPVQSSITIIGLAWSFILKLSIRTINPHISCKGKTGTLNYLNIYSHRNVLLY